MMVEWKPGCDDPKHEDLERAESVRRHLKTVLAGDAFKGGKRAQDFLQLVVEHALAGRTDNLRERMLGAEMFGRPIDYDTANDAVVRVKASEVRKRLVQHYKSLPVHSPIRIELQAGSYMPQFSFEALLPVESGPEMLPIPASLPVTGRMDTPNASIRRFHGFRNAWLAWPLAVGLLAILATGGWFALRRWRLASDSFHIRSLAILPLSNLSGDPRQDYFADGMTEELIADLGQISSLRVISRTSIMTYKGTQKTLPQIAKELHVDGIVEGSVAREGNQIRITTQLIDSSTDQHIWAHTYTRDLTSVLDLQSDVARAIADQIQVEITPQEHALLTRSRSVSAQAQEYYLQGMESLNSEDVWDPKGARALFEKAIQADPDYAPAHAALAETIGRLGNSGLLSRSEVFDLQHNEALKAIALDDSLPQGHIQLGYAAMNHDWDLVTERKQFQRAIELNPNLASSHLVYADYLERVGRIPEAISETNLALQLDPVSSHAYLVAGYHYYFAREYDQALTELNYASALHADSQVLYPTAAIHTEKGMYGQAIQEFQKLDKMPNPLDHLPYVYGHMGNAYARMGRRNEARAVIAWLQQNVKSTGVGGYEIAVVYAGLKENDHAFEWLEKAYSMRDKGLTFLKIDPCLDPLRSDPRFDNLEKRVGLPL